jgi:hypothetical protein
MLLLLLIPIAWLTVVGIVVAVCKASAHGDAQQTNPLPEPAHEIAPGLVVWDPAPQARTSVRAQRARSVRREPTAVA